MKITLNLDHSLKKKRKEKKLILDIYAISLLRLAKFQAFQYAGQAMGNWGICILTSSIKSCGFIDKTQSKKVSGWKLRGTWLAIKDREILAKLVCQGSGCTGPAGHTQGLAEKRAQRSLTKEQLRWQGPFCHHKGPSCFCLFWGKAHPSFFMTKTGNASIKPRTLFIVSFFLAFSLMNHLLLAIA